MKHIACIGSRKISSDEKNLMEQIGAYLVKTGWTIHTGNAQGSDQAFTKGGNKIDPVDVWLYLPWASYEKQAICKGNKIILTDDATDGQWELAEAAHPAWHHLSQGVQKLMVRNVMNIEGCSCVVARTNPKKIGGGGTGHNIRIAEILNIPVYDLSNPDDLAKIKAKLNQK